MESGREISLFDLVEENKEIKLTKEEKIELYLSYFRGRETPILIREKVLKENKYKYYPLCQTRLNDKKNHEHNCLITKHKLCQGCKEKKHISLNKDYLIKHLRGEEALAIYQINEEGLIYFISMEFVSPLVELPFRFQNFLKIYNIDSIIKKEYKGNLTSLYIFFEEATEIRIARNFLIYLYYLFIEKTGRGSYKDIEKISPSQNYLPKNTTFGPICFLPLNGGLARLSSSSLFLKAPSTPFLNEEQLVALKRVKKVDSKALKEINERAAKYFKRETYEEKIDDFNLTKDDFKSGIILEDKGELSLSLDSLSRNALNYFKYFSRLPNKDFLKKEKLRLNLYNLERFIYLYKVDEDLGEIHLPRGMLDLIINTFSLLGVKYVHKKTKSLGKEVDFNFLGTLREDQEEAKKEILKHDNGVIVAPTASGKTVIALNLIAELKVNALIIVNSFSLMERWKSAIKEFLGLEAGTFSSKKKALNGIIDVASIQSLGNNFDLLSEYGTVIIDEVHHIGAETYEESAERITSSFVYGFTATPNRSDHNEELIYKVLGDIIYRKEIEESSFDKFLLPRFFDSSINPEENNVPILINELISNEKRNEFILKDIKKEYKNNSNILVLSDRVEQVENFYEKLKTIKNNVFMIHGKLKDKEKKEFLENVQNLKDGYLIISTGKYIGEGFDLPSLNTLFLTTPFKWEGNLEQYLGRINREDENKTSVKVYDYVDLNVRICAGMFKERLAKYFELHYLVEESEVLDENTYFKLLMNDLKESSKEVLFFIRNFNENKLTNLKAFISSKIKIIFKDNVIDLDETESFSYPVYLDVILIDSKIMYLGTINPFTYRSENRFIYRITNKEVIRNYLENTKLFKE